MTAQDGATALFKACHKGHSSVVEELLKYKPSLGLLPVSTKLVSSITHGHCSHQNLPQ
jgi:hypothetical protein